MAGMRGVIEPVSFCGTTWAELPAVWQSVLIQPHSRQAIL